MQSYRKLTGLFIRYVKFNIYPHLIIKLSNLYIKTDHLYVPEM